MRLVSHGFHCSLQLSVMFSMFSLKVSVKLFEGIEPRLELGNEMELLVMCIHASGHGELHPSFDMSMKFHIIEKGLCATEQRIFVLHGGQVVMESLVLGLIQCVQFDMDISFPFGRHEGILEALEEVSEGESSEFIIMNRDPVFLDVTFQHGCDFDCLFVISDFLVGDITTTSSHEVMENFSVEFAMV